MKIEKWGDISLPYTIISIDLGETTGIATYELGKKILRFTYTKNFQSLFPLLALFPFDVVLLERFPVAHSLEYVLEIAYRNLTVQSVLISPSTWKPFMQNKKRKFEDAETQHENDAINMLRYYLLINFERDVP